MRSLLFRNILLTIPTAFAFTILGYIISLPASFLIDPPAIIWQLNLNRSGGIETQRLSDIGQFQVAVALGGMVLGTLVAQTTFIMYSIKSSQPSND